MTKYAASMNDVIAASKRIEGHGHRTPILTNKTIDDLTRKKIFFKCENFQKIGAFKFRGGWNTISSLSDEEATALGMPSSLHVFNKPTTPGCGSIL